MIGTYSTLLVYAAMACYVIAMVAFAVDVSALGTGASKNRRRRAAGIGMAMTWLAAVVLLVALVLRGFAAGRVPWANMYEFTLMFTFFLTAIFLVVQRRRDIRFVGVGVALLSFLALFLAVAVLYVAADGVQPALDSYWLIIHVSVATLATGLFGVSALLSILQLVKGSGERSGARSVAAQESGPDPVTGGSGAAGGVATAVKAGTVSPLTRVLDAFPAATDLERIAYRLNAVGFVAWTFTLVAGAIWAEHAWGRPWGWDPKETWTFVVWVIYAAYLHARVTTGWAANRFAYFALMGFVALLANFYIVNIFFNGRHSYSGL
ncbi:c-type cytochrome biogenesis protein CcsB [Ruania halotolerans]|uniref:c-type cytochrome biogenesis protein CcsB n=1 Tax=Ruania halotolerans TaxID=2897773 RepID=UPI001E65C1F0|nr:c-type cytochrome biogenesis protein CcsB [Ruania halotolerans]UFU05823.1 c-type cytochrome biogenesis protein CcsB [Ruania halotolerans]